MNGKSNSRGFSLVEVMVTVFILAIALLGLAGLQARALTGEYESFSRGQAMLLVNDMADRMAANLAEVKTSTTAGTQYNQPSAVYGTGYSNPCITAANNTAQLQATCCAALTPVSSRDLCEWDLALKGISQLSSSGSKAGTMADTRGCVFQYSTNVFEIDVVWRGRDATGSVASDITCGSTAITSNRRAISRRIRVADLGS